MDARHASIQSAVLYPSDEYAIAFQCMSNPQSPEFVLASASPRRRELLREAGFSFDVEAADVPEVPGSGEPPLEFARRVAREKARAVWQRRPGSTVLGADTIVVVAGELLGKPEDAADAARMLRLLSAREHQVTTAVCLLDSAGKEHVLSETTLVRMRAIFEDEIHAYVATGEPLDKAGAYAIQGGAAGFIERIEGDYSNVVGLPVEAVRRLLSAVASARP